MNFPSSPGRRPGSCCCVCITGGRLNAFGAFRAVGDRSPTALNTSRFKDAGRETCTLRCSAQVSRAVHSLERVLDAMQMTVSDLEVSSVVVLENWNLLREIGATHTG
jgi:hypothetical protein